MKKSSWRCWISPNIASKGSSKPHNASLISLKLTFIKYFSDKNQYPTDVPMVPSQIVFRILGETLAQHSEIKKQTLFVGNKHFPHVSNTFQPSYIITILTNIARREETTFEVLTPEWRLSVVFILLKSQEDVTNLKCFKGSRKVQANIHAISKQSTPLLNFILIFQNYPFAFLSPTTHDSDSLTQYRISPR